MRQRSGCRWLLRIFSKGARFPQTANCVQLYRGQHPVPRNMSCSSAYILSPPQKLLEDTFQFHRILLVLGHERLIQVVVVVAGIENLKQIFLAPIRTHSFEQPPEFKERITFRMSEILCLPG